MEFAELAAQLNKGALAPIYLVLGPEPFLRGESVRLIRHKFEGEKGAFDLSELDAGEGDVRALFEDLQVPSLFAPRRLVIVENAGGLFTGSIRMLAGYARHPARGTVLVMVAETIGKTTKRRKGPAKKKTPAADEGSIENVLAAVTLVVCDAVQEKALPSWCMARARLHGKAMDARAARQLVDLAGAGLGQLDGQIQSLVAYCKDRPRITADDVVELVGGDHARNVWELVRAVGDRQPAAALKALDRLLRDGEITATGIVILLAREARRLAQVKSLLNKRTALPEIARRLRLQDWLAKRLAQSVRQMTMKELQGRLEMLLEAELACKTGMGRERWLLERTVLRLCGLGERTVNRAG
jgi:DNA polymerase-3 subunit delta